MTRCDDDGWKITVGVCARIESSSGHSGRWMAARSGRGMSAMRANRTGSPSAARRIASYCAGTGMLHVRVTQMAARIRAGGDDTASLRFVGSQLIVAVYGASRTNRGRPEGKPAITRPWPWNSPPARLPAAAHAGLAQGRARAAARGLRLRSSSHLVQRRLARRVALAGRPVRRDLVIERNPHLVEVWLVYLAGRAGSRRGGRLAAGARDRDCLGSRIIDHRQLGRAQPFDLIA